VDPATLVGKRRLLNGVCDVPDEVVADYEQRIAERRPFRDLCYCLESSSGRGVSHTSAWPSSRC
jgi:hypothetical protein